MEIIDNKALLLKLRDPQKVTSVIPKSKEISGNRVLVKWGLDEAQVLKNLKIRNVPSPIVAHYDWPGLHKPFEHQKVTASFLTLHKRAFCLNEQGTGKTGSVIWAADYLLKQKRIRRVLVICPLSIMDSAWRNDLFKFAMHRSVDIAHGSAAKTFIGSNSTLSWWAAFLNNDENSRILLPQPWYITESIIETSLKLDKVSYITSEFMAKEEFKE